MSNRILFGTDGIRAEANVYPMTGEVAMKVGRALVYSIRYESEKWKSPFGQALRHKPGTGKIKIVIGKDTSTAFIDTGFSGILMLNGNLKIPLEEAEKKESFKTFLSNLLQFTHQSEPVKT